VQLTHHNYKRVVYPLLTGSFTDPLLAYIKLYLEQLMASSSIREPCVNTQRRVSSTPYPWHFHLAH